ncbi:NAD-dependent epimerase/dehydratase family protein [Mycobacterium vicinigordonae]|uniref:NAD-dependent epimerase/dehydratase family protein n=1 Tax=Mycobacterium vicinigordonae TaxID=1719132 RepID=A0A7D6E500_9MYCO|nr:NAD-dependent epimerase/dehydratase family protein [Mycobacterium vicinigordonae]QLL09801.1 NAD-dependent epimerase/dehydratase family protein [Mycobacterium vicinigordonae]
MRIAVTGASGVFGRGIAARLRAEGHQVVGLARHRPRNWFSDSDFVHGDIRDADSVRRAVAGADVVAHCAWMVSSNPDEQLTHEINIGGTQNVLEAMDRAGSRRIVFASSVLAYGARPEGGPRLNEEDALAPSPDHFYAFHKAQVERLLAKRGKEWVAVRPGIVVGRGVDNTVMRLLGSPAFPNVEGSADRPLQIVHTDDVHRLFVRAVLGDQTGAINLAAPGEPTVRAITAKLGRRLIPARKRYIDAGLGALYRREIVEASPAEFELLLHFPIMDTSKLVNEWGYRPAWNSDECLGDFALAVRGRIVLGKKVLTLPWRIPLVHDMPAVDEPATDGVPLQPAGPDGLNGEFDSLIDPRFPTYVATNLSEALPGPFSPASASATVRGLRAGGVSIAERLRVPGVVGREMAARSVGTFGHRVYGGVTSVYYIATSMPGTDPDSLTDQFFGRELGGTPVFGPERPPQHQLSVGARVRDLLGVGLSGIGLVIRSAAESADYVRDIDRLEALLPTETTDLDDSRLESFILLARDLVVHGWTLSAWAALLCTATATFAGRLGGGDVPNPGREVASARVLTSLERLVELARANPKAVEALSADDDVLGAVQRQVPELYREIAAELARIGHRGPAECELLSSTYADDPEQFTRMIAKSLVHQIETRASVAVSGPVAKRGHLAARLAARQLREREVRRDKVVRATAILRRLMREFGRRLVDRDILDRVEDVFFFLVDELEALPPDARTVVVRRRAEMSRLAEACPPGVFSGSWQPIVDVSMLQPGQLLQGLGVSGGRIRGRVRIVSQHTIGELEPGEVLVAEVTDVGYTPAFAYAAAVVTNLGGPMSHAAIVAREFGISCVVDARNATRRLPPGAWVEVDGSTGEIRLLESAAELVTRS